jgi:cell division protein FtsL
MSNKRKSGWAGFSTSQKIFYIVSLLLVLSMVLGLVSVAFTPAI